MSIEEKRGSDAQLAHGETARKGIPNYYRKRVMNLNSTDFSGIKLHPRVGTGSVGRELVVSVAKHSGHAAPPAFRSPLSRILAA